jgi:phosphatidylserine decarboxylase
MMKFAKEGYLPSAIPAVAGVVAWATLGWPFGLILLIAAFAVLMFFRDPERTPLGDENSIVSPADGKVVFAGPVEKPDPLAPESRQRISIFMSPLNVHVNRMPSTGTVEGVRYSPGRFDAAFKEKASDVNESNAVLLRTASGFDMVVVQIAGWLARRIVCKVTKGNRLARGERFGLIMFGSRVDVYLPAAVSIKAQVGQRVAAGSSIIAESR